MSSSIELNGEDYAAMVQQIADLQRKLDESHAEVERLRAELARVAPILAIHRSTEWRVLAWLDQREQAAQRVADVADEETR